MAAYTTPGDVTDAIQLTGQNKLTGLNKVPPDLVQKCIDKAQGRIDAFLRVAYVVPLTIDPVPAIIKSIATDFAASFVVEWVYSQRKGKDETTLDDKLFKRAEADLQRVISLSLLDGIVPQVVAPQSLARPAVGSTTYGRSPLEDVLDQWP